MEQEKNRIRLVKELIHLLQNQLEGIEDEFKRKEIFNELRDLLKKEIKKTKDKSSISTFTKELINRLETEIEIITDSVYKTELVNELKDILWKEIKHTK